MSAGVTRVCGNSPPASHAETNSMKRLPAGAPRTIDDAVQTLLEAGVPAAPVTAVRRGDQHPQHDARGFFEVTDHPVIGPVKIGAFPIVMGRQPAKRFARPAPRLGEHNREVLGGLLGITDHELETLAESKIIGTRPGG